VADPVTIGPGLTTDGDGTLHIAGVETKRWPYAADITISNGLRVDEDGLWVSEAPGWFPLRDTRSGPGTLVQPGATVPLDERAFTWNNPSTRPVSVCGGWAAIIDIQVPETARGGIQVSAQLGGDPDWPQLPAGTLAPSRGPVDSIALAAALPPRTVPKSGGQFSTSPGLAVTNSTDTAVTVTGYSAIFRGAAVETD
jgi:hypothetical protein